MTFFLLVVEINRASEYFEKAMLSGHCRTLSMMEGPHKTRGSNRKAFMFKREEMEIKKGAQNDNKKPGCGVFQNWGTR